MLLPTCVFLPCTFAYKSFLRLFANSSCVVSCVRSSSSIAHTAACISLMFHIVYLHSCLPCCSPVETLPAGPCVIFVYFFGREFPPSLSASVFHTVTISLPLCFVFSPFLPLSLVLKSSGVMVAA